MNPSSAWTCGRSSRAWATKWWGRRRMAKKPFTPAQLLPAIEIARARYEEALTLQEQVVSLEEQLETRKLVDRAKGMLMTYQQLSEPQAFRLLQRQSMQTRKPLR